MELESLLAFAVDTAERTGEVVRRARNEAGLVISHKRGVELLTSADLAADALICDCITAAFPQHRILAEESRPRALADGDAAGPWWIVDPIDGTVNYAYGHPQVAVSLAYAVDGIVQVGVVHAPFQGETFTAWRGGGARLNGVAVHPSECAELCRALVATGFPYEPQRRPALLPRLSRVLQHCRDLRRAGSAALDLCWVAAGRLDGFYETLSPWDMAAGRLIAVEAGARVGNLTPGANAASTDLDGHELVAAAPGVYPSLVQLLSSATTPVAATPRAVGGP